MLLAMSSSPDLTTTGTATADDSPMKMDRSVPYDLIIVGRGMIGSAAARHAAKILQIENSVECKIALVGPSEIGVKNKGIDDPMRMPEQKVEVYGAHYDEGRITRKTDQDPIWAELASRSIDRYDEIKKEANADNKNKSRSTRGTNKYDFYVECGHLAVGTIGGEVISSRIENANKNMKLELHRLKSVHELKERFPYLTFPNDCEGIFEEHDAGYISARGLVSAQTNAAKQMGVHVYDKVVEQVMKQEIDDDNDSEVNDSGIFEVTCSDSTVLTSNKVLVTSGAFTNARALLPVKLDLKPIKTQTVQFFLNDKDASSLQGMPSVIFKNDKKWAYILPPIRYPDGSMRLKLGGALIQPDNDDIYGPERILKTSQDVMDWYEGGGTELAKEEMTELLHSFVPSMSPLKILSNSCATLNTPTRQAYIGQVSPGWAVGSGGNGFAAKSSDELGRLAALCILRKEDFAKEKICGQFASDIFRPQVDTIR